MQSDKNNRQRHRPHRDKIVKSTRFIQHSPGTVSPDSGECLFDDLFEFGFEFVG